MNDTSGLPLMPESGCGDVPVFNCIVLVRQDPDSGRVTARVANLDDITVNGGSERDALQAATREFKRIIQLHLADGRSVPFRNPPATPEPGERERFVPVHL